jgi:SAM-dependent methyltransferase
MDQVQEIDVEQIMRRIRENIRRRRGAEEHPTSEKHTSPFADGQAATDFAYLHSGYDIQHVSFVSHRRILGPLLIAVKKVLRKLLTPILERQTAYNAANVRVTTHIKDWIASLDRQHTLTLAGQSQALHELRQETLAAQSQALHELRQETLAAQSQALHELRQETLAAQSQALHDMHAQRRQEILAAQVQALQEMNAQRRPEVLAAQLQALQEMHAQLRPALDLLGQQSTATRERISRAERKLRRILHALGADQPQDGRPTPKPVETRPASLGLDPDFDYAGFEERFRGSEEDIKKRQRIYVQYFEGRENIIDIGCGRGEFLELLRESGITARGVDLDLDMILLCREKGLDVALEDAFAYLQALPDDAVGGIFAAQVIEHLHPQRIIELMKLCHRKLQTGGGLILETPNPTCLMVFADSFYKDPSHVQPAHPDAMQFILEATGFDGIELKFLAPVDPSRRIPALQAPGPNLEQFNQGIERLNALLFGFQDYAVIGRKRPVSAHADMIFSGPDS